MDGVAANFSIKASSATVLLLAALAI